MSVWDLSRLTASQRRITEEAIAKASFNWELLVPGLRAKVGRQTIPVEWVDLSRYGSTAALVEEEKPKKSKKKKEPEARAHSGEHNDKSHVIEGEIKGRRAALGLAWYSGKISIEKSLESDPALAQEVFLAEGAHMVDFFFMTDKQRADILAVYAKDSPDPDGKDDWFEESGETDYFSWTGESFMSGFIHAYAPDFPQRMPARQPWVHRSNATIGREIRRILTPTEPFPSTPPVTPQGPGTQPPFFSQHRSKIYHSSKHRNTWPTTGRIAFATKEEAERAGKLRCLQCRPHLETS